MTSPRSGTENLEMMEHALNYNAFLLRLVKAQARRNEQIVDFGAGMGSFAKALAADAYTVRCVEPDSFQATRISSSGLAVVRSLDDVGDSSIDYLYTLNVLEHIEDDVGTLRLCFRKLRPGGRILIYVPAFQLLYSSMDRKVGHYRRYTRGALAAKVQASGFTVCEARYVDSAGFLASLAFRFVGDDAGDLNRRALVVYDRMVFPVSRVADIIFWRFFGKNVLLRAKRPPA